MAFQSKNMNYIYNVSYFEGIRWDNLTSSATQRANEELLGRHNHDIECFRFKGGSPMEDWKELKGYGSFSLYTMYPGLLIGTGNEHSLKISGALKCGFTFDYTTGLPYIPGSSLKGAMRACFPGDGKPAKESAEYESYIKGVLNREDLNVNKLKEQIFENRDMFLGAFPVVEENGSQLMQMEFITPHTAGKFKNPNPISQIKVRPNVKFEFCFVLTDYVPEDGSRPVTAEDKLALFKTLILDMGIGAKTHVGFGRFSEGETPLAAGQTNGTAAADNQYGSQHGGGQHGGGQHGRNRQNGGNRQNSGNRQNGGQSGNRPDGEAPICASQGCRRHVGWNMRTGQWYRYCAECGRRQRMN